MSLGPEILGRQWAMVDAMGALDCIAISPTVVKLADAKHPLMPLRRYTSTDGLADVLRSVSALPDIRLLVTHEWLPIQSEYRAFTERYSRVTIRVCRIRVGQRFG